MHQTTTSTPTTSYVMFTRQPTSPRHAGSLRVPPPPGLPGPEARIAVGTVAGFAGFYGISLAALGCTYNAYNRRIGTYRIASIEARGRQSGHKHLGFSYLIGQQAATGPDFSRHMLFSGNRNPTTWSRQEGALGQGGPRAQGRGRDIRLLEKKTSQRWCRTAPKIRRHILWRPSCEKHWFLPCIPVLGTAKTMVSLNPYA